ncbi:MAG TPA: DUF3857 and transglutaminase domain-containing protein, partial [bacterium]
VLLSLVVFSLFSCAAPLQQILIVDDKPLSIDRLPKAADFPDAGAYVVSDEAFVEVFQHGEITMSQLTRRIVVKVFNAKGYKYANVLIPYDSDSKVSGLSARTMLPDGRSATLSDDQVFDSSLYPETVFFSDVRAKRFTMPAVEDGCVLIYQWTKTTFGFTFWTRWEFQWDVPVGLSKITVRCPNTWDIRWKVYGESVKPQVEPAFKELKADHVWRRENIPAFVPEIGMPPGSNAVASILFSPVGVKDWNDIAAWYLTLSKDRIHPSDAVRKKTLSLIQGISSQREKLKRLFEFVRCSVRYVAIEIGLGGYQPHFADWTLKNRYGDCKDMVALLLAMAESAGLAVDPVMIPTWHFGELDTAVVSPAQFNHLIARANLQDGSELWMDPTDETYPFGRLPWYDQERLAVVVDRSSRAVIRRTPGLEPHGNTIVRTWKVISDSSGRSNGQLHLVFHGAEAEAMRASFRKLTSRDVRDLLGGELVSRLPSARCGEIRIQNQDSLDKPLEVFADFIDAKPFCETGEGLAFQPGAISLFNWNALFPESERKYPIEMRYPIELADEIRLSIPIPWHANPTRCRDSVNAAFGDYMLSWEAVSGTLTAKRRFRLR